jgi:hypothetical protein
MTSYLHDYLHYTSGNECPEPYRIWSAMSLLASVLGRKVWTYHGRFQILPSLYVILVGDAGSGKSTAKNESKKLFSNNFPDYLISASFQSHQDIIDQMCNAQPRVWEERDEKGTTLKIHGYTPFYIVCNEFSSLLSTDKKGMVEFLVDIFDENEFSTGFKTQRTVNPEKKQRLDNPYVNVLACAVPKWFMSNLKLDLFEGGLGRRLIIVYSERTEIVPDPVMPPGGEEAKARIIEHLKEAEAYQGELQRTPDSRRWWVEWYTATKKQIITDPILGQFYQTKPVMVLKVASLLTMSQRPFTGIIDTPHLEAAAAFIGALEPSIVKLTSGIGRNELAGVGAQLLDYIIRMGGSASERQVKKYFNRYLNVPEFNQVLQHFSETQELFQMNVENNGFVERVMMTPEYHSDYMIKRSLKGSPPLPSVDVTPPSP